MHLTPGTDPRLIQRIFGESGRVHIGSILAPDAANRIYRCLIEETPWQMAVHGTTGHHDLPVESVDELQADERSRILDDIERAARQGFAYRYATFRIDDHYQQRAHRHLYLMTLFEFLNSPEFLQFARLATGVSDIAFVDAQATRYRSGDFLTPHDDNVAGKNRRVAYVLNFTPNWKPEWGGLLAFPDPHGHLHEAYCPAFNALNLMRVPMPHMVTQVSSFVTAARYSVTGWFRHG